MKLKNLQKRLMSAMMTCALLLTLSSSVLAIEVVGTISEDNSNSEYGIVESGTLDNGVSYWLIRLSVDTEQYQTLSDSCVWSGKVKPPIANSSGTNGEFVADAFDAQGYIAVHIGNLPSTMPTVHVSYSYTDGSGGSWLANVSANTLLVFQLKDADSAVQIKTSTSESISTTAKYSVFTSETNPAEIFF